MARFRMKLNIACPLLLCFWLPEISRETATRTLRLE